MSVKMSELAAAIEVLAPIILSESWDNIGLMVGEADAEVSKILVALDVTDKVIEEAEREGADCIVTHHPLIFSGLKKITAETPVGRKILRLVKGNISVYSAHTNLDIAKGGTNDTLAGILRLKKIEGLMPTACSGEFLGRTGELEEPIILRKLAEDIKKQLKLQYIGYYGNAERSIKKVGIVTGSGGGSEYIKAAVDCGCDAYITGDIKYHLAQEALDLGLVLIDATHYATEVLIVKVLCDYIRDYFSELTVIESQVNGQLIQYV